nr:hypothetical protein [Tanacetum cinerariifolium]
MESLDKRVVGVETSMEGLKTQVEGLKGLDFEFMSMREDFREALNTLSGHLKHEIHNLRDSFMGEIMKIREEFRKEVSTLHQVIKELQEDIALYKLSLASGGDNTNHGPKIDVPKPSPFVGKREARAVDDFLIPRHYGGDVGWAKTELERRRVQDLFTAIAHVEALIDFSIRRESYKPKDQKVNKEKGGGKRMPNQ